jgi:methylated-DNA-protein-cysteine methyltransferase-like protein
VNEFFSEVYKIVAKIPRGKVATYGQIARMLGSPRGARTVGWAMRAVSSELKLPCHRVVNRLGELSPDYVFGASELQRAMLEDEGVTFKKDGRIELEKHLWDGK